MKQELLSRVPIFSMLDPLELTQLHSEAEIVTAAAGDYVFRAGDPGDALYIVESGLLEVVLDEETVSERTLNALFQGDFFGEMALLTQGSRTASVRALVESGLIRISYDQFAKLLDAKPKIALQLSRVLSHYLTRTNNQLSRQATRITALIPMSGGTEANTWIAQVASSLERQFGRPSIIIQIQSGNDDEANGEVATDFKQIQSEIRPLPNGGQMLRLTESALDVEGDHALVSIINGIRTRYGYILVNVSPAEAFRRLKLLTRFDQCCMLYSYPYDSVTVDPLSSDLSNALRRNMRSAWIAPLGTSLPPIPPLEGPPVRLPMESGIPTQAGIDRLSRAIAGKTVGLALGSGTAQGLSHLGIMQSMLSDGIPIDLIAGTSGGALYGSMVASGMSIEEAVHHTLRETRRNLIDKLDFTVPTRGIIRGARIERMIRSIIGDITFEATPIPLYAVATDLNSGEEIVLHQGPVYRGVRASISVPGIFEPYPLDGRILVDGVVVNPLPVSVARSMGADIVIAVQVPAPGKVNMEASARSTGQNRNGFNMISSIIRSHHFVGDRLADQSALDADVFIKPDVTRFGWREYRAAADIIAEGVKAGEAAMERIKELLYSNITESDPG